MTKKFESIQIYKLNTKLKKYKDYLINAINPPGIILQVRKNLYPIIRDNRIDIARE